MKDIKQTVATDIINLMIAKAFTPAEEAVLSVLTSKWSEGVVSQREIAESPQWKAAHPLRQENTSINTATRNVRRVINNLRVTHKLPILHNANGHYLPETETDVAEFISKLELEAKARAVSTLQTYKVMKETFGISSPTFDRLETWGNQLVQIV